MLPKTARFSRETILEINSPNTYKICLHDWFLTLLDILIEMKVPYIMCLWNLLINHVMTIKGNFLTLRNDIFFWKSFTTTSWLKVKKPESLFQSMLNRKRSRAKLGKRWLGIVYFILAIIYFFSSIKHNFNQSRSHQKEVPIYFNQEVYHLIFFRELLTTHLSSLYECWCDLDFTYTLGIALLLKHFMCEWGW